MVMVGQFHSMWIQDFHITHFPQCIVSLCLLQLQRTKSSNVRSCLVLTLHSFVWKHCSLFLQMPSVDIVVMLKSPLH